MSLLKSLRTITSGYTRGRFTVPQRLQSTTTTQQSESQANPPTQQQPELSGDNDMPIGEIENPYTREKRQCVLCRLNIDPDYKNVRLLSQFQSRFTGRIYGKHITGLCTAKQRKVEGEILKAQATGLMGYYTRDPRYAKDPKLFDPDHPFRNHRF